MSYLRAGRLHSLRQRLRIRFRARADSAGEARQRHGHRSAGDQPVGERYPWPPWSGRTRREMRAMALALDRQIGDFVAFLNQQYGQGQFWLALTADHGVAPLQATDKQLKLPGEARLEQRLGRRNSTKIIGARLHKPGRIYSLGVVPHRVREQRSLSAQPERSRSRDHVAEAMKSAGFLNAFTKEQMGNGELPPTPLGHLYLNSYSPYGGAWVMGVPTPFAYAAYGQGDCQSRSALQLRSARAAGILWTGLQSRRLSRPGRADRSRADARCDARNQQANEFQRARTDGGHCAERSRSDPSAAAKATRATGEPSVSPAATQALAGLVSFGRRNRAEESGHRRQRNLRLWSRIRRHRRAVAPGRLRGQRTLARADAGQSAAAFV